MRQRGLDEDIVVEKMTTSIRYNMNVNSVLLWVSALVMVIIAFRPASSVLPESFRYLASVLFMLTALSTTFLYGWLRGIGQNSVLRLFIIAALSMNAAWQIVLTTVS